MNNSLVLLKVLGVAALLASLGLALWGLSAPMGVWFDWWDFRKGFGLLRSAHGFALWVAIISAVIAVLLLIVSKTAQQKSLTSWSVAVFISSAFAALIYIVPETFRPPEGVNYPPIHDVSTDTDNPPEYVDVLPLRINAPNTVVYGGAPNMTPEKNAELQKEAYPDLVPWETEDSVEIVFDKALAAVKELGWELVSAVPEQGRIEATATTFWFRFKDDVVIYVKENQGSTVVNARSLSRVGTGDVGANAMRLRKFFTLLDE